MYNKVYRIEYTNACKDYEVVEYDLLETTKNLFCYVQNDIGALNCFPAGELFSNPNAAIQAKEDELLRNKNTIELKLNMIWRLYRKQNGGQ